MVFAMSPAGTLIANNLVKPELDPAKGNDFIRSFPAYLDQLTLGQGSMPDNAKLYLLENSVPAGVRAEIQRRRESHERGEGPPLEWGTIWTWLVRTYGSDTQATTKAELKGLQPVHEGKLTRKRGLPMQENST